MVGNHKVEAGLVYFTSDTISIYVEYSLHFHLLDFNRIFVWLVSILRHMQA